MYTHHAQGTPSHHAQGTPSHHVRYCMCTMPGTVCAPCPVHLWAGGIEPGTPLGRRNRARFTSERESYEPGLPQNGRVMSPVTLSGWEKGAGYPLGMGERSPVYLRTGGNRARFTSEREGIEPGTPPWVCARYTTLGMCQYTTLGIPPSIHRSWAVPPLYAGLCALARERALGSVRLSDR